MLMLLPGGVQEEEAPLYQRFLTGISSVASCSIIASISNRRLAHLPQTDTHNKSLQESYRPLFRGLLLFCLQFFCGAFRVELQAVKDKTKAANKLIIVKFCIFIGY